MSGRLGAMSERTCRPVMPCCTIVAGGSCLEQYIMPGATTCALNATCRLRCPLPNLCTCSSHLSPCFGGFHFMSGPAPFSPRIPHAYAESSNMHRVTQQHRRCKQWLARRGCQRHKTEVGACMCHKRHAKQTGGIVRRHNVCRLAGVCASPHGMNFEGHTG